MTTKSNNRFVYAVHKGRKPGIYFKWADCEDQVKGFESAEFKKFSR
jgi:viroplasmin and RNaseH domain-containing protein